MAKYKKATRTYAKQDLTVFGMRDWIQNYADCFQIVDPKGIYTLEYTNIAPDGEPAYIQELKFTRTDRPVRNKFV